jgi:hypothetical protein
MGAGGIFLGFLLLAVMMIVWVLIGAFNRQQLAQTK